MKDLKLSIVESLDGESIPELFPFLPYLLQDLEEIGTDPRLVERLIRTHIGSEPLKVLDLGCGKGAVAIHLAQALDCVVTGIDGMHEFVETAKTIAKKKNVDRRCSFIQGDIRGEINHYKGFDIIILGAIGPVFGFMGDTLRAVSPALKSGGFVIIDDGFKEDGTLPDYSRAISRSEFYAQIQENGFTPVAELIIPAEELAVSNNYTQQHIIKRANELIISFPEKQALFSGYVRAQEDEIVKMENQLVVGIWLLKMIC